MQNILLTGGLGYIGSHICIELLNNNYNVIIVDNFSNCKFKIIEKIKGLTNRFFWFYGFDIGNTEKMEHIFKIHKIDIVIHLAGYKSVNESISNPITYYQNNVNKSVNLFQIMNKFGCKKIIFSSSATVYSSNNEYPVSEDSSVGINLTNPYGKSKYMLEEILKDIYRSDNEWSIFILRYFNPAGSHPSGLIGEDPRDKPNNLFPHILKACSSDYQLNIFGFDYDTVDGTCVRDYIHVVDLAKGHLACFKKINNRGVNIYNLGSGKGVSVLEFVNTFMNTNNVKINYKLSDKRPGDVATVYSDVDKVFKELEWKTEKTLEDICSDGYNFYKTYLK